MNDRQDSTTETYMELSSSQTRILLAELNHPGTRAYHLYSRLNFAPEEREWIIKAMPYIFCGNFSLRLGNSKGSGYMLYSSGEDVRYEETSGSGEDTEELFSKIKKRGIAPLFDSPLYRIHLIRTESELILFCVFHHLIADGTTVQSVFPRLLRDTVRELKAGNEPAAQKVTYGTYIERVKNYSATDEAKADVDYWVDKLTGYHGIGYKAEGLDKGVISCELCRAESVSHLSFWGWGLHSCTLWDADVLRALLQRIWSGRSAFTGGISARISQMTPVCTLPPCR